MRTAFFEVKDWAKEYMKKKITSSIEFKGYMVHASDEEPQYLVNSDKSALPCPDIMC